MKKIKLRTLIPVAFAGFALASAACSASSKDTSTLPPDEGSESMDAELSDAPTPDSDADLLVVGIEYELEDDEPEYTSVEPFVLPTMPAACGYPEQEVYFEFDSAQLTPNGLQKIQRVADCLNEHPLEGEPVTIMGHADPRGSDSYNRELGIDRANAVEQALIDAGVDADRIDSYSYGEHEAHEDSPTKWDEDRRTEVRLDH